MMGENEVFVPRWNYVIKFSNVPREYTEEEGIKFAKLVQMFAGGHPHDLPPLVFKEEDQGELGVKEVEDKSDIQMKE